MYTIQYQTVRLPLQTYIRDYRDTEKFIMFCRACNRFNACWTCPPHDFDTEEYLAPYREAYLIGAKVVPEEVLRRICINTEQVRTWGRQIIAEVRTSFDARLLELEATYPQSRAFFAGACRFCQEGLCKRIKGEPCIHPEKIRPSLESLGFDVDRTTTDLLHVPLRWGSDSKLPEYFMLIGGFLTSAEIDPVTPLARRLLFPE